MHKNIIVEVINVSNFCDCIGENGSGWQEIKKVFLLPFSSEGAAIQISNQSKAPFIVTKTPYSSLLLASLVLVGLFL